MQQIRIVAEVEEYQHFHELPNEEQELVQAAQKVAIAAYAPYSGFFVGAALLLEDGTVVSGSNQENVAFPSGICAERTAMCWAGANYPGKAILKWPSMPNLKIFWSKLRFILAVRVGRLCRNMSASGSVRFVF